jgi:hypothetical protein
MILGLELLRMIKVIITKIVICFYQPMKVANKLKRMRDGKPLRKD